MRKKVSFLILIFILLISVVFAQPLEISSIKIDSKAFPGSEVIFQIKVKNNQIREDVIKINPDPFSMQPFSDFATSISVTPTQQNIPASSEGLFEVKIRYSPNVKAEKAYAANVFVQSLLNSEIKEVYQLTSFVFSSGEIISMKTSVPDKIVPGREIPLDIIFKNNLNQDFIDMDFFITSSHFNEEHKFSLLRNQEITKAYSLKIPSETPAGEYSLFLRLYKDGSIKGEKEINFILEESKDLQEQTNREVSFLSSKITITKINNGNVIMEKKVKYPINLFQKFFTETSLKGEFVKDNDKSYYEWNLIINPKEQQSIVIETDYNSLFFSIFALIILFGVVYYTKIRSLRITKKVVSVKEKDNKYYLKIIITVQNYTSKDLHDIKIVDLLPRLIKHYSDFGTLEPKNIQQGSQGLRFVWEIHKLHKGEERIISYKIEPQLNLFGNIKLPPASLQFTKNNKLVIRRSNIAKFELKKVL